MFCVQDRYDVALLELERPVQLQPHIQPICLPGNTTKAGVVGMVAGWGATSPDPALPRPTTLQAADLVTLDNRDCEAWHAATGIRVTVYKEMLCAGHR